MKIGTKMVIDFIMKDIRELLDEFKYVDYDKDTLVNFVYDYLFYSVIIAHRPFNNFIHGYFPCKKAVNCHECPEYYVIQENEFIPCGYELELSKLNNALREIYNNFKSEINELFEI